MYVEFLHSDECFVGGTLMRCSPMARTVRILLVGAGALGSSIAKGLVKMPGVKLAIFDVDLRRSRALAEGTDGLLQFKPGTIYPILNDLEKQGIVRSSWVAGDTGPQRKAYELTATGREVLASATKSWGRLRHGVDATLAGGGRR